MGRTTTRPSDRLRPSRARLVVLHGGEYVNASLIREEYATAIRTCPYARRREFLGLETQSRLGRWAN